MYTYILCVYIYIYIYHVVYEHLAVPVPGVDLQAGVYHSYYHYSFMALPSAQDRSEDGNESVLLERSETHPSDKLVL